MKIINCCLFSTLFYLLTISIYSCSTDNDENNLNSDEQTVWIEDEQLLVRHIESLLKIGPNEKYSYHIYKEHLDGDDSIDVVASVNLKQRAYDDATRNSNHAQKADLGYLGNYNYIFSLDGASKKVSQPIPVASSPLTELKVNFENIRSDAFKDVVVEYRVLNGGFYRYYAMTNRSLMSIMELQIFDKFGSDDAIAYSIKYEAGSYSLAKDIVVYKATINPVSFKSSEELYKLDPEIIPTSDVERRWHFSESKLKYFTVKENE